MDNSPSSTIQQHPSAIEMYLRHGWKLTQIPYGSKGPTTPGWNQDGNWLQDVGHLPKQFNIGLLHAYSGTMALDIDDWAVAQDMLSVAGIDLTELVNAPDAVTIDSGNANHGKLLYAMPFGLVLPSKRITGPGNKVAFELRSGTSAMTTVQDVIPPSVHPVTGQQYRWGGRGRWDRLPTVPFALMDYWQQQLDAPPAPPPGNSAPVEWSEIEEALSRIPAGTNRDEWLQIGMALHHQASLDNCLDTAYRLFLYWSSGDSDNPPKNFIGERDIQYVWSSFKQDQQNPVRIGTLFSIAFTYGYKPKPVDASALFSNLERPADLFAGTRPPSPDLDMNCIPETLATRAMEVSQAVGCDPIVPVFAGIGAVCGAVDSRMRLKLTEGYTVPPILWLATIGSPSDRKTPGSKPMLTILHDIEREDRPNFKRKHLEWRVINEHTKAAQEAFLEQQMDILAHGLSDNTVPIEVPDTPAEPKPLVMVVNDITSQKLMHHGAAQPRGMVCHLDEMKGWIDVVAAKTGFENRSTWIQGYEGGWARMDRVGSGGIIADPFSVSIFGNVQPSVWRENLNALSADGFVARFIVGILRPDYLKLSEPIPDELTTRKAYENMIRMIYALPSQTYTLSPEAYNVFRDQQQWSVDRTKEDQIIDVGEKYGYAFGKGDGGVGRIALVFHLMNDPFNPQVSAKTMRDAVGFYRTYVTPALHYAYGEIGGHAAATIDNWMASYVLAHADQDMVSMRDIKRSGRRKLEKIHSSQHENAILEAMLPLEACHWVIMVENDRRTGIYRWAINPELKIVFADYRKQVITIKQRRRDEIEQSIAERKGTRHVRRLVPGYDPNWD